MIATATRITCTDCNAPLRRDCDSVFQLCQPCMDRWFALAVIGTPSRYAGDTSKPYAQHVRDEANRDCEADLVSVQCSECPRVYRMDDVPDGVFVCPECEIG